METGLLNEAVSKHKSIIAIRIKRHQIPQNIECQYFKMVKFGALVAFVAKNCILRPLLFRMEKVEATF